MCVAQHRSLAYGGLFVLLTVACWIGASFIAQALVRPDEWGHQPTLQPLLLVLVCTSLLSLYLPILSLKRWCYSGRTMESNATVKVFLAAHGFKMLPVAVIWFMAQYTFTLSLANTSVTSNTILSSSSSMFTLLASALILQERITFVKLASVAAVMAGTAMVTLADSSADESPHALLGDGLCVLAAILYSTYTVTMQKLLKQDDPDTPALFFGFIGAVTAAVGLPAVAACHLLGVYSITKIGPKALVLAVFNGLMDYLFADYTWARAVLLLGPTVATLGMSLQIPVASLLDLFIGHPLWLQSTWTVWLNAAGTVAILGGVVCINLGTNASSENAGNGSSSTNLESIALETEALLQVDAADVQVE